MSGNETAVTLVKPRNAIRLSQQQIDEIAAKLPVQFRHLPEAA